VSRQSRTLRAFASAGFRVWFGAALASQLGIWVQRIAQDWMVFAELTAHDAVAVGLVAALQLAPPLLLLPLTGRAADRFDTRRVLVVAQAVMAAISVALALLALSDTAQLWQMYVLAGLHGCAAAFDAPARQSFVSELVPARDVPNAVGLISTAMNIARLGGPALAGLLTVLVGAGWVFLLAGGAFVGALIGLCFVRRAGAGPQSGLGVSASTPSGRAPVLRYLRTRPDLLAMFAMVLVLGLFGPNITLFASAMAVHFGFGAEAFGLLSSAQAIGAIVAAVLAGRAERPARNTLIGSSAGFGAALLLGALSPTIWWFAFTLALLGAALQLFLNTAGAFIQLSTPPHFRGRMVALFLASSMALAPVGSVILGMVVNGWGAPAALVVTGVAAFVSSGVGVGYLVIFRRLRLRRDRSTRFGLTMRIEKPAEPVTFYGFEEQKINVSET